VHYEFVIANLGHIATAASNRAHEEGAEIRVVVWVHVGTELGD
jgi:hypothetical protein